MSKITVTKEINTTKILIVEDETTLREMYAKKFTNEGYTVETATNGQEALEKMHTFVPELVLMDVMMPKLDGLSALEEAKKDPKLKDIPIVMLTNLSTTTDAVGAVKKGALDYIVKSDFTPAEIVAKVAKMVGAPPSKEEKVIATE